MTHSRPAGPGLVALGAGAALERKAATPGGERSPEAGTPQAATPDKPASASKSDDTARGEAASTGAASTGPTAGGPRPVVR
jgi:hypothetical protein